MIETVVVLPNSRVGVRSYTKIKSILEINSVERMKDASTKLPLEDLQAKIKDLEDSNSVMVPPEIQRAFEGQPGTGVDVAGRGDTAATGRGDDAATGCGDGLRRRVAATGCGDVAATSRRRVAAAAPPHA